MSTVDIDPREQPVVQESPATDELPVADALPAPCKACEHLTLAHARKGDQLEILEVGNEQARVQALRFGMAEGACVTCVTRIPAGPLVVRSGRQDIAIGRHLASQIRVRPHVIPGA